MNEVVTGDFQGDDGVRVWKVEGGKRVSVRGFREIERVG